MAFLKRSKSLKYKLAISQISMIIIPLLLMVAAELVWHHAINPRYLAPEEPGNESVLRHNSPLLAELDDLIISSPDRLMDKDYLRQLNQRADSRFLIIIEKAGEFIFLPDRIERTGIIATSMELKSGRPQDTHGYSLLKYRDLRFSDGSPGSIYLLTRDKPPGPAEGLVFVIALLLGIIINLFISYRVASGIIKPLGILNRATAEISQGNLDRVIESPSDDEVGELCQSFENMRQQLKEAQSLSRSYEKNRKELIANISHDLKTPITSIRGYVQGIMEGVASTPEMESKYVRTIYSNAVQMDRLIDELFLFSKLDLKQLEFDFEAVDIEGFLHDCVEDKGYDLEQKGIRLNYLSAYSSQAPVVADRQRLKRVMNNIMVNAEQHREPARGDAGLEIILSENAEEAVIEIKDNGQGISPENLPYIFDRLYRGDPSRNRQSKGSGLGLSIARQIIEAHGGRIWAESELDIGTSIFFTLKKRVGEDSPAKGNQQGRSR